MVSVWQVVVVILALSSSQISAVNPLRMLESHLGSLYDMRDRLSGSPSGRGAAEAASAPVGWEPSHDSSGGDFHTTTHLPSTTTPAADTHYSSKDKNSVLGSLFELGVSDMEGRDPSTEEGQKSIDQTHVAPLNDILREINNMTFLPLVPMDDSEAVEDNEVRANSPLLLYLDGIRGSAWGQFKSMALSYSNWLDHEYQTQHITDKLPLDLIKKILDLGDKVNFLHVVGKRVDPGLAEYLAGQLQPLFSHFESLSAGRMLGGSLSSTLGDIVRDSAKRAMRQFVGHVLRVAGNFVTREELDGFKLDLAKSSPLAAEGLDFVLNGFPSQSDAEGRSLSGRGGYANDDAYGYGFSSGGGSYGGYGAYDDISSYSMQGYSSGGYAAGVYLDPYLILGGLGAAVLLAFLAYRVIVTTEKKARSFDDLTFMDLSDVPRVVHSLYGMLDGAEDRYRRSPLANESDDLAQGLNSLWREHVRELGCVRCSLFDFAVAHDLEGHDLVQGFAVSGLAHLLGAERSGQLVDEVAGLVLEGLPVTCEREANTCTVK